MAPLQKDANNSYEYFEGLTLSLQPLLGWPAFPDHPIPSK